jgi:hypothetical protein
MEIFCSFSDKTPPPEFTRQPFPAHEIRAGINFILQTTKTKKTADPEKHTPVLFFSSTFSALTTIGNFSIRQKRLHKEQGRKRMLSSPNNQDKCHEIIFNHIILNYLSQFLVF